MVIALCSCFFKVSGQCKAGRKNHFPMRFARPTARLIHFAMAGLLAGGLLLVGLPGLPSDVFDQANRLQLRGQRRILTDFPFHPWRTVGTIATRYRHDEHTSVNILTAIRIIQNADHDNESGQQMLPALVLPMMMTGTCDRFGTTQDLNSVEAESLLKRAALHQRDKRERLGDKSNCSQGPSCAVNLPCSPP